MLAHAFPNLEWLKKQANTSFADRKSLNGTPLPHAGWPNVIMNVRASGVIRDDILGPLTIFSTLSGQSAVTVDRKRVTLTPGVFFISNDQEYYTLEIAKEQTETANVHFGHAFMREAFQSMSDDPSNLLDEPAESVPTFHNRVVQISPRFQQIMEELMSPGKENAEEEQQLFDLLTLLVVDEIRLRQRREKLSALRSATREEIMRRLLHATDYLYSVKDAQPDLEELARISCLSKFHFLRLFKIAFGETPHEFITGLKIEQAKRLLQSSKSEVKEIAISLGYKDASTFSRRFHQNTGLYPSQYRMAVH